MLEIAVRQALLHALIASGSVEATLRAWGTCRPATRLRFWLLASAFPFLVVPILLVGAPMRSTDRFAAGWALFASQRWNAVQVAGLGVDTVVFALMFLAGTLLFLRDAVPFLIAVVREHREDRARHVSASPALAALIADLAAHARTRVPSLVLLRTDAPTVFVRGARRETLVLSEGLLAQLSPQELRATLAHELAHLRFRDPLAGWALMAARLAMFWNPAVQLTARAIVQEMEHRADEVAAEISGAQTFASALGRLASLEHSHISGRVASVLAAPARPPRLVRARLAIVGAAVAGLVFFVV